MKNPATMYTSKDFNVFTEYLISQIELGVKPMVKMRNGVILPISWFVGEKSDLGNNYFCHINETSGLYLIWNNDGTSIKSKDLDMMETI